MLRDITLAREAGEEPAANDVRIWKQYAEAIKGKRGIELSRSMNALLKTRPPDEDTADPPEVLATLPRVAYAVIRERRLQAELLEAFRASTSRSDRTAAAEANAPQAKDSHRRPGFDLGGVQDRTDPCGHPTAEQTHLVQGRITPDLREGDLRHNRVLGKG